LLVIPEIYRQFQVLKAAYQQTICVSVKSFSPLSATQEQALIHRLNLKLSRQIELTIEIDENLLGGLVIQAGDLVIDGSVRTKLQEMYASLIAA
jgi:F-type H+-transporting ATPase subunit delta